MDIGLIFKIAGVGILLLILDKMFREQKQDNIATMVSLTGLVIVFMMVLGMITKLFDNIRTIFQF
jgi:stage III sporulation protein AC